MELEYIKVSDYAKLKGNHYRTIMRHYKNGLIEGYTNEYGRTYLKNPNYKHVEDKSLSNKVILYARVSSTDNSAIFPSGTEYESIFLNSSFVSFIVVSSYSLI